MRKDCKRREFQKSSERFFKHFSKLDQPSILSLLGTLSRLTGQFQQVTTFVAGLLTFLPLIVFLRGAIGERQCEAAILRAIGWSRKQVRKQFSSETAL